MHVSSQKCNFNIAKPREIKLPLTQKLVATRDKVLAKTWFKIAWPNRLPLLFLSSSLIHLVQGLFAVFQPQ